MTSAFDLLTSPAILFFVVGMAAAFARSDLHLPDQAAKTLSLYLMLCIGFKGGVEARLAGGGPDFAMTAALGLAFSALAPLIAYAALRRLTRLDRATICAMAATYGSVSVVTFAAAQQHLTSQGVDFAGYMAAVLALMETPAILTALILLNRAGRGQPGERAKVLREVFVNAAAVMLIGSFVVGMISGERGLERLEVFVGPLFQGALCFFLLDVGLIAARRLMADGRKMTPAVVGFALAFPVASAFLALILARQTGLAQGDATLLAVLAGSASYIAVPAAMRLAAPQADAGVYVSASLAVTFPFNLLIGISAYAATAAWLWA
ncbi:sodium-dependent bicarbonate transport family permease [Brevundimonas balnearis]|uniref:Sodium-dependent bicarbonate transport family permease n=1 Tax=Brevundimonas balnearis TaxID=1572858 RepID=A0ABV6R3G3_9CAUL